MDNKKGGRSRPQLKALGRSLAAKTLAAQRAPIWCGFSSRAPCRFRASNQDGAHRKWGGVVTRTVALLIGCIALFAGVCPTYAGGLGWKVLSHQSAKEPEVCFYSSANVFRSNDIFSVWTKCLDREDLNKAVKDDSTGTLSDIAAEKIAHDYVPPVASLRGLKADQFIDAVIDEELANNGNIRPLKTVLREIDCPKWRTRELSVIVPVDGQVRSSDTPQHWRRIPNLGDLASLSKLLCTNSPTTRSKVRWASHAATRSHWHRRSPRS